MHILLVEDDHSIAVSLVDGLTDAGHTVELATTGADALAAAPADLVLLDLGLPDMDGRDVCRTLRGRSKVPIIMLTARSDEFDRVLGLELGADDYVTKPFSFRELLARIRSLVRRTSAATAPAATTTTGTPLPAPPARLAAMDSAGVQAVGALEIDRRARRIRLDTAEITLTAKEFDLLAFLATDAGAVYTRTDILEHVWDAHWYGPTKTVDAHVAALRRKLGDHRWIAAVRGVGFRLEPPA